MAGVYRAIRCLLLSGLLVFASGALADACSLPSNAADLTRQLVAQINTERARHRLAGFRMSRVLSEVAQRHACENARHNRISHIGIDGSSPGVRVLRLGYDYRHVTENVAIGYTASDLVLKAWLSSSSHRRNILDPRTFELGLAVAVGADGRIHWVMNGGVSRS